MGGAGAFFSPNWRAQVTVEQKWRVVMLHPRLSASRAIAGSVLTGENTDDRVSDSGGIQA